jgi:hypothetical protein
MGVAMRMQLGEAFKSFRGMATQEELQAADVEYESLAEFTRQRIDDGTNPTSLKIAVMMLALELVSASVHFSN